MKQKHYTLMLQILQCKFSMTWRWRFLLNGSRWWSPRAILSSTAASAGLMVHARICTTMWMTRINDITYGERQGPQPLATATTQTSLKLLSVRTSLKPIHAFFNASQSQTLPQHNRHYKVVTITLTAWDATISTAERGLDKLQHVPKMSICSGGHS